MRGITLLAMLASLAVACGPPPPGSPAAASSGTGADSAGAAVDDGTPLTIRVVVATYGKLVITTAAGATCRARAVLPSGGTVLAADFVSDQVTDTDGQVLWLYRTPVVGAGSGAGQYEVTCGRGQHSVEAQAAFDVP
jgi:hypothetical protein